MIIIIFQHLQKHTNSSEQVLEVGMGNRHVISGDLCPAEDRT